MADIFISYKREDRDRILPLARCLQGCGYTVWWDLELIPSQKFERQIKMELDEARCVVVVWTQESIGKDGLYTSGWMQTEAEAAEHRGILLPVQMEPSRKHWRHAQSQYADLNGWTGDEDAPGFVSLLRGVILHVGIRERPVESEIVAWRRAETAEKPQALYRFLADFSESRFAPIAEARLRELEELAAWRALGDTPNIEALATFLRSYPVGRFADLATSRIKAAERLSARTTPDEVTLPASSMAPNSTVWWPLPRTVAGAVLTFVVASIVAWAWGDKHTNGVGNRSPTTSMANDTVASIGSDAGPPTSKHPEVLAKDTAPTASLPPVSPESALLEADPPLPVSRSEPSPDPVMETVDSAGFHRATGVSPTDASSAASAFLNWYGDQVVAHADVEEVQQTIVGLVRRPTRKRTPADLIGSYLCRSYDTFVNQGKYLFDPRGTYWCAIYRSGKTLRIKKGTGIWLFDEQLYVLSKGSYAFRSDSEWYSLDGLAGGSLRVVWLSKLALPQRSGDIKMELLVFTRTSR
jgi:hypothetical protein